MRNTGLPCAAVGKLNQKRESGRKAGKKAAPKSRRKWRQIIDRIIVSGCRSGFFPLFNQIKTMEKNAQTENAGKYPQGHDAPSIF
jgi:hypothetical protein